MIQGIGKLERERERELIAAAQAGDEAAREELVRANVGFVAGVARRRLRNGIEMDDLVQMGLAGLTEAINRYDLQSPKRLRLLTFAYRRIDGAMLDHLRYSTDLIRRGRLTKTSSDQMIRAVRRLDEAKFVELNSDEAKDSACLARAADELVDIRDECEWLLSQIPDDHRDMVRRAYAGESFTDIAADYGMERKTVWAIVRRRVQELRENYAN